MKIDAQIFPVENFVMKQKFTNLYVAMDGNRENL